MDLSGGGVVAVVPTVFHDDGALDREGTAALVDAYGSAGVDGFIVLGTMGEGDLLDDRERREVLAITRSAASGLPVIAGVHDDPSAVVSADALLFPLVGASAEERRAALDTATTIGLPLVLQHHPAVTRIAVPADEVAALSTIPAVAAVKAEAPPTPDLVAAVVTAGGPPAFGGLSALYLLEELEAGAVGAMTGLAVPERLVAVVRAWQADDHTATREAYAELARYLRIEAMPGSIGIVARKEAWRQRGVIASSRVRRGDPLGAVTRAAITRRLQEAGVGTPRGVVVG